MTDRINAMRKSELKLVLRATEHALLLHFARSFPVGTRVRRTVQTSGERVITSAPRMDRNLGPVVSVEGLNDTGLNCRCVQLYELLLWNEMDNE